MNRNPDEIREILKERIESIERRIVTACQRVGRSREAITLIAVTKTVSWEVAAHLKAFGIHDLGENRPQEFWNKATHLKDHGFRWHLIGHLQRNKIEKSLTYQPTLIHSVDSIRLLKALDLEATKRNASLPFLLEVNVSREANKQGFAPEELIPLKSEIEQLKSLRLHGLMTMAAYDAEPENCRATFRELRELRDQLKIEWADLNLDLSILSMGMSNDFEVAIEEGATMIRLGTVLFQDLETIASE